MSTYIWILLTYAKLTDAKNEMRYYLYISCWQLESVQGNIKYNENFKWILISL